MKEDAGSERGRGHAEGSRPETVVPGAARGPSEQRQGELFPSSSPREILARIVPGDPLGVRAVVARRLKDRCLLLDPDRVHLRALALCARDADAPQASGASRGRGSREWIGRLVDLAVDEVARSELRALRDGRFAREVSRESAGSVEPRESGPPSWVHADLARPLRLDPNDMRAACARFNQLSQDERATFLELFVEARSLDELAREQGRSASTVARRARRALLAVLDENEGEQP